MPSSVVKTGCPGITASNPNSNWFTANVFQLVYNHQMQSMAHHKASKVHDAVIQVLAVLQRIFAQAETVRGALPGLCFCAALAMHLRGVAAGRPAALDTCEADVSSQLGAALFLPMRAAALR